MPDIRFEQVRFAYTGGPDIYPNEGLTLSLADARWLSRSTIQPQDWDVSAKRPYPFANALRDRVAPADLRILIRHE